MVMALLKIKTAFIEDLSLIIENQVESIHLTPDVNLCSWWQTSSLYQLNMIFKGRGYLPFVYKSNPL